MGAGIAGLCAALSLVRAGFEVEIVERASKLEETGAGIQLSPNALRVLDRVGVLAALREQAVAADRVTLRDGRTGRQIAEVPVTADDGMGYLVLHRAALQGALMKAVEAEPLIALRLDVALEGLTPGTNEVVACLSENGEKALRSNWLVIGADGVHSTVARSLELPAARETGVVAYRYLLNADAGEAEGRPVEAWLGPAAHAVAYPISGGERINLVLLSRAASATESPAAQFAGWDARLQVMLARGNYAGAWTLRETEPDRRLVHGAVCLIGDAAHAMMPFAAQGAAMAIEDAHVLARELAFEPDMRVALARFEAERLPRLERLRKRVAFHDRVYHLPRTLGWARNAALAMRSRESLAADLSWLYDWRP
ncbi:FAD-dependent monooxygenase [Aureimonas mangrovi]|uniref:FAD-dependent monooxygenase n=1 Tax=Aureimonas mangrovi TaxID=2758041 RepID=UPI00163DD984|nr:FAD-dependent monooxygenase [Aureimonas mangrovi]